MKNMKRCYNLRRRRTPFSPSRGYLNKAVEAYLKNGGIISKITLDDKDYNHLAIRTGDLRDVDEFLMGV